VEQNSFSCFGGKKKPFSLYSGVFSDRSKEICGGEGIGDRAAESRKETAWKKT
jgi:hypothetical protein